MITVVGGENRYQTQAHAQRLINDFIAEYTDLGVERFDAQEVDFQTIQSATDSLPFLVSKKLVIVENFSVLKEASDNLKQLQEATGDSVDVLIVEAKLDKRSAYYKFLKKQSYFHEYGELDERALVNWLVAEAKARDGSLSTADARFLIQRQGLDQLRLSNELHKLLNYDKHVTKATIELLTTETPATTIFNLIDSIFSGNARQALRIYDEQRRMRVEPQAIQGMLVWQMHAVAMVASAPKSLPAQDLAKTVGMSPFVVQKSQRIASKMNRQAILACLQQLRDIDYKSKRYALDYDEALRFAIVSLAQ
jgi:DNA polymerase III subunit delta